MNHKYSLDEKINVEISFFENQISKYKNDGLKVMASSSFQSHSIPMLHLISEIDNSIPIYFIDTGFHFPETLKYRDEISSLLNLNVQITASRIPKINLLGKGNMFMFSSDPNLCCTLNKVEPLDAVSKSYDIWITGVRKSQNSNRSSFDYEATTKDGLLRFHPMINWDDKMINTYIFRNKLPAHPLEKKGYKSIGCAPCTGKPTFNERSGRWEGTHKTECGLHLGLTN